MVSSCKVLFPLILIGILIPVTNSAQSLRRANERFDPDGSFWIQGTPPAEFKDFGGINLNSKRLARLPAAGVDLVHGTVMRFKTLTVKRQILAFTTVVARGISYSFSGRFLKGGVFSAEVLNPDAAVLEGTLTKWQRGRKVAEAKLKFTYFGGT